MLQPYMNFVQHGLKVMTGCFTSFSTKSWEELALAVFGRWALVDTVANLEPRYDILIKDCVLVAVPICAVACHFVYAIRLLDPLEGPPL